MALTKIRGNVQIQNLTITNDQIANKDAQNPNGILLSKIEDGNLLVKSNGSVAFTAPITGVTPTAGSHLATKSYVDNLAQGLDAKKSVRAVATGNVTMSGTQTIDGVSLVVGDRVLLTGQTNPVENGIYVVAADAWSRAADASTNETVTPGLFTFVEEGSQFADTGWVLTSDGPTTLGTTPLPFVQFSAAGQIDAGAGLVKTGNVLEVASANAGIKVNADNIELAIEGSTLAIGTNGLKLANVAAGQILVGNSSGVLTAVGVSGDVTLANDGTITINNGAVTPNTIADASLPLAKLAGGTAGQIIVANASGAPTYVTPTGDVTVSDTGSIQIVAGAVGTNELGDDAVTGDKIADAAVGTNHLANGAVTLSKLDNLQPTEIIIGTASGNVAVTLSGDVTLAEDGTVSINPATVVRVADIVKETPSGSGNTFTLSNTPKLGTLDLFVNGILQEPGAGNDYELFANTITLAFELTSADKIRAHYFK